MDRFSSARRKMSRLGAHRIEVGGLILGGTPPDSPSLSCACVGAGNPQDNAAPNSAAIRMGQRTVSMEWRFFIAGEGLLIRRRLRPRFCLVCGQECPRYGAGWVWLTTRNTGIIVHSRMTRIPPVRCPIANGIQGCAPRFPFTECDRHFQDVFAIPIRDEWRGTLPSPANHFVTARRLSSTCPVCPVPCR